MSDRARIPAALLGLLALVAVVLLLSGGDGGRTLHLSLDNAGGLQDGSQASIGGVPIGKVSLDLGDGDKVLADVHLDDDAVVPRDAQVAISAVNFLGQKQVSFSGGDRTRPAPDGYRFPSSRITTSTDLDQVLNTLDPDTSTRLSILVNEAGASVIGRRWDISRFVRETPKTLADADTLLARLIRDNHTLSDVVASSDRFVGSATSKRAELVRMVDTLGKVAETVETKRTDLQATLAKAPGTLTALRGFLGDLEATTAPLGPAAGDIARAAPPLRQTLAAVDGFRESAEPTLKTATKVAPALTKLASGATPVLRQARPPVESLAALAVALKPVSDTLDGSADNLIATIENWSQAIQLRDGVGHIFRGEATFSPNLLSSALDRLMKPADKPAARRKRVPKRTAAPTAPSAAPAAPAASTQAPKPSLVDGVKKTTDGATKAVKGLLDTLLPPAAGGRQQPKSPAADVSGLLDFLLRP